MTTTTTTTRFAITAAGTGLILATVVTAGAASFVHTRAMPTGGPDFDYENIAPPRAETEAALRAEAMNLRDAIARVENEYEGLVRLARWKMFEEFVAAGPDAGPDAGPGGDLADPMDPDAPQQLVRETDWLIEVEVLANDSLRRIMLDPDSGDIVSDNVIPRIPGLPLDGMEPTGTTELGVVWHDIVEGGGDIPPDGNANVRISYTGYLLDGSIFEASDRFGDSITQPLNTFFGGWQSGMESMRVGGTRKLIIPPVAGFGVIGSPPRIPASATLVIDVELLDVIDYVKAPPTEELPGESVEGDPVTTESGLKYWVLTPPEEGAEKPAEGAIVTIIHTGWLTDGTEIQTSVPDGVAVDLHRSILGWVEAIRDMRVGERRKIILPSDLAYGNVARRGVPPRATLIYDLELVSIENQ